MKFIIVAIPHTGSTPFTIDDSCLCYICYENGIFVLNNHFVLSLLTRGCMFFGYVILLFIKNSRVLYPNFIGKVNSCFELHYYGRFPINE